MVIGDLIGTGGAREEAVVGRTPHLAARLQTLAQPGAVVISASTKRLVGRLFDCTDLGVHDLKGFEQPVQAWRVLSEGAIESRFEATHPMAELTPLRGRDRELQLLVHQWQLTRDGAGQIVTLSGEPGIGQVAAEPRVARRHRRRAACAAALLLLAPLSEHCFVPCDWTVGARRGYRSR